MSFRPKPMCVPYTRASIDACVNASIRTHTSARARAHTHTHTHTHRWEGNVEKRPTACAAAELLAELSQELVRSKANSMSGLHLRARVADMFSKKSS
jgi:hypothetical protein